MGLLDILKQFQSGGVAEEDVHGAFDEVAGNAPSNSIAEGLAHAFNSDQTPPFPEMLAGLFGQSNPQQKAGLLNQIIGALGPTAATQLARNADLSGLTDALTGANMTPQQAELISPAEVQALAHHASKDNPSIVDMAASFYAEHPTLVKTIGAGALAILMSKISQRR